MGTRGRSVSAVLAAGIWITVSEFVRNELLVKTLWVEHYRSMGLAFPSNPVNGIMWMVWSFLFAGLLLVVSRKFTLLQTALIGWVAGFVLMWIVIGNLLVLPYGTLPYAVPLGMLEAFLAAYLVVRIAPAGKPRR